jgi:hypothetical protein
VDVCGGLLGIPPQWESDVGVAGLARVSWNGAGARAPSPALGATKGGSYSIPLQNRGEGGQDRLVVAASRQAVIMTAASPHMPNREVIERQRQESAGRDRQPAVAWGTPCPIAGEWLLVLMTEPSGWCSVKSRKTRIELIFIRNQSTKRPFSPFKLDSDPLLLILGLK